MAQQNNRLEVALLHGTHGIEDIPFIQHTFPRVKGDRARVRSVWANPEATNLGLRYIHEDLNRAYPGDFESVSYERRRAAELIARLKGDNIVSNVHDSTPTADNYDPVDIAIDFHRSYADIGNVFAVQGLDEEKKCIMKHFDIDKVIDLGVSTGDFGDGTLLSNFPSIAIEFGNLEEMGNYQEICAVIEKGVMSLLKGNESRSKEVKRYQPYGSLFFKDKDLLDRHGFAQVTDWIPFSDQQKQILDIQGENVYPVFVRGYPDRFARLVQYVDRIHC